MDKGNDLLKKEIVDMAVSMGALAARVASREMLSGPPSADPTYVLPGARSVIAFAVPLDKRFIRDYFAKVDRIWFKKEMYDKYHLVDTIGTRLVEVLKSRGFRAFNPNPNGIYREEERPMLYPDFSHRYAAVASGLGTFGWSGNVLIEGQWATVFLGSVVTDAVLTPDSPLEKSLCDNCKVCTRVCPQGYINPDPGKSMSVTLGGREYVYTRKRSQGLCGLVCAGLVGISRDGKWSTWGTLRYKLPDDDKKLWKIRAEIASEPSVQYIIRHTTPVGDTGVLGRTLGVLGRTLEDTNPTCCNCVLVCSGPREERLELMKILHSSGVIVRLADGTEKAVRPEELDELFTKDYTL